MTHLKNGDFAPKFRFKDECGRELSLADLKGKVVALCFYPKDLTPSCTNEVCNLRDNYKSLLNKNIYVIGVSADSEKSHTRFTTKNSLPFPLVADTDKQLINEYGVWGEKQFMGRTFDGIRRTTFLIDEEGKIKSVIEKVVTKEHAKQILDTINS